VLLLIGGFLIFGLLSFGFCFVGVGVGFYFYFYTFLFELIGAFFGDLLFFGGLLLFCFEGDLLGDLFVFFIGVF
jgi:hypothetical protein